MPLYPPSSASRMNKKRNAFTIDSFFSSCLQQQQQHQQQQPADVVLRARAIRHLRKNVKGLYIRNFAKERKRKLWINAKNRSRLGGKKSEEVVILDADDDEELICGGCGVTSDTIVDERVRAAHVAACKVASTLDVGIRMSIDNACVTKFELSASHHVRLTNGSVHKYCCISQTQTYFRCGVIDNFVENVFVRGHFTTAVTLSWLVVLVIASLNNLARTSLLPFSILETTLLLVSQENRKLSALLQCSAVLALRIFSSFTQTDVSVSSS